MTQRQGEIMEYKMVSTGIGHLEENLNQHAKAGWTLHSFASVSPNGGIVAVMERPTAGSDERDAT